MSAGVGASVVFQVARVEGQAMSPTIRDQDRLIVNRIAYRLAQPQRGDIVMHRYPFKPDKSFVKRIIAKEGDRVEIVAGSVYLNDALLDDAFVAAEARSRDNWGPQVVPKDSYFVLGDRCNNSADSRHWGFVPRHYILGRVQARWWPVSEARSF